MRQHTFNIITISGKIGTGKSLIGDFISMKYGFRKYAFADELKEMLEKAGWDSNKDEKGRKLLQSVGKAFREYDKDFWIKKLCDKILDDSLADLTDDVTNVVITDARHINEIENITNYIKGINDFITIKIDGNNYSDRYTDGVINNDISETGLDSYNKFNYIINNNTTIENVYNQVDMIMNNKGYKRIVIPELC